MRTYRVMRDISVREMAAVLELEPSTYFRFEKGETEPTAATLAAVLRWLLEKEK